MIIDLARALGPLLSALLLMGSAPSCSHSRGSAKTGQEALVVRALGKKPSACRQPSVCGGSGLHK